MWTVKDLIDAALRLTPRSPELGYSAETYREALSVLQRRWDRLLAAHPWSFLQVELVLNLAPGTSGTPYLVDLGIRAVDIRSVVSVTQSRPLKEVSSVEIDWRDPGRTTTGSPDLYAQRRDLGGSGGLKLELWPVPTAALTVRVKATRYEPPPSSLDSTVTIPWDSVLMYGIASDLTRQVAVRAGTTNRELGAYYWQVAKQLDTDWSAALSEAIAADELRTRAPKSVWESVRAHPYDEEEVL